MMRCTLGQIEEIARGRSGCHIEARLAICEMIVCLTQVDIFVYTHQEVRYSTFYPSILS